MRHQNSSRNFFLIWEHPSHFKSIASYDETKIPLNLRRKTVSQILSREDKYSQIPYALLFNLAPGLVAAPGIRKVYTCAWCWRLNGFWLKVTWWRYLTFHFSVCNPGVKRYGRKVAEDTLSSILFKILAGLGFYRTKVSVSKKMTSSGTSRSRMTSSISWFW